jgi:DNA-binding MltR family transcriptional regulator
MIEEDIKDFSAFLKEFQNETDRGAALVGAALLDQKLTDILRAFMVESKVANELLDGAIAPLGTFFARIKAAFALALIDEKELHECDLIRKVRNEFAHRAHGTTFADPKIKSLCNRFESDIPGEQEAALGNPRAMFVNAVVLTVLQLTYRANYVSGERRTTQRWPY